MHFATDSAIDTTSTIHINPPPIHTHLNNCLQNPEVIRIESTLLPQAPQPLLAHCAQTLPQHTADTTCANDHKIPFSHAVVLANFRADCSESAKVHVKSADAPSRMHLLDCNVFEIMQHIHSLHVVFHHGSLDGWRQ